MDLKTKQELTALLGEYVTPEKKQKIDEILAWRTRYVTVGLENVYQPHNASAIVRSAECFGIQDVHAVQSRHSFNVNQGISRGSAYWMTIDTYPEIADCFSALKKDGYRIVATTPHTDAQYIHELPLDQKTVLFFGTERTGLSEYSLEHADAFVKIPMVGFTESFNVSVSVALCLYDLTQRLRTSTVDWHLRDDEKLDLTLEWYRRIVRAAPELEKRFFSRDKRR